jgi:peptidoglycan/xylan/chitin deacetylase (PgdA/CDA1 family)
MRTCGVLILVYHRISPNGESGTTLKDFIKQLSWLKERFCLLSLNEVVAYIKGKIEVKKPAVCLTFDDGFVDAFSYAYHC